VLRFRLPPICRLLFSFMHHEAVEAVCMATRPVASRSDAVCQSGRAGLLKRAFQVCTVHRGDTVETHRRSSYGRMATSHASENLPITRWLTSLPKF